MLEAVGNVALGVDQKVAWQADDALIRATTGRWRQLGDGRIRYINANHGKITIFKLPNIRATPAGGGFCSIGVRIGPDAFDKSHNRILV